MVGDKISELIISIKNASKVSKEAVVVQNTKLNQAILKVLADSNFIESVEENKRDHSLKVVLKYDENEKPAITDVKRVSKLSKRIYKNAKEIFPVKNGFGMAVISTPAGIMSDSEARKQNIGGEVMFKIW